MTEVSLVLPCLNEEETIAGCIKSAKQAFRKHRIDGEIIVVDNGSTDNSAKIARSLDVKVVQCPIKGYGNAYLKGFSVAKGNLIIMADSDGTYNLEELHRFVEQLSKGYDFVIGTRLKGRIVRNAMPVLHRYVGNPVLSFILRLFFGAKISDSLSGFRAIRKKALEKLQLVTTGFEFASEMVIKAIRKRLRIKEIPITYYRRRGRSKLKSFHDGWKYLRFMLLYSPGHLFLLPGLLFFIIGTVLMSYLYRGPKLVFGFGIDYHFLGALLILLGYQLIILWLYARLYLVTQLKEKDRLIDFITKIISLERGLLIGLFFLGIGFVFNLIVLISWVGSGFGGLFEVRKTIVGLTLILLGTQTIFSSFFLSVLGIERK